MSKRPIDSRNTDRTDAEERHEPDQFGHTNPPGDPFMTARQIVQEFFPGAGISPNWVMRRVPGRVKLGHRTVVWRRSVVAAWLAQREGQH